jgi:hypothetical protein
METSNADQGRNSRQREVAIAIIIAMTAVLGMGYVMGWPFAVWITIKGVIQWLI